MRETRDFLIGLMVGAVLGTVTAMLYAPASGEAVRRKLKNSAEDVRDRGLEAADAVKHRAEDATGQVRHTIDDLSKSIHELTERTLRAAEEQKAVLQAAVVAGKNAYAEKRAEFLPDSPNTREELLPESSKAS